MKDYGYDSEKANRDAEQSFFNSMMDDMFGGRETEMDSGEMDMDMGMGTTGRSDTRGFDDSLPAMDNEMDMEMDIELPGDDNGDGVFDPMTDMDMNVSETLEAFDNSEGKR